MHIASSTARTFLQRWWFTVLVTVALITIALLATPAGQTIASEVSQATGRYYRYLAIVFKSTSSAYEYMSLTFDT
jgi:hypothetical protein